MKDEIKKQIEEEANRLYPVNYRIEYGDEGRTDINEVDRLRFIEAATFGYNIKESVDVDWKKLRDDFFDEHIQKDTGGYIHITTAPHDLFEWFKSKFSASKNTVSNKEYAQQEREKAVRKYKERLIKAITLDIITNDGYDSIIAVQSVIEKIK
jgi:hypothetical protein